MQKASVKENRANSMPVKRGRGSTVLRGVGIGGFFLFAFARILPLPRYAPDILLDSSYAASLTYFRPHGIEFGRDAVYTYGPLGYLVTFVFTGYSEWAQFVGAFALALLLAFVFAAAAARVGLLRGLLLFLAVLFAGQNDAPYVAAPAVAYLVAARSRRIGAPLLILLGGTIAVVAQIKFTFCLMSACAVLAICCRLFIRGERVQALIAGTSFVATYTLLWLLFGGGPGAFGPYLRGSFEVAAGYGQTMYLSPDARQLQYALTCIALVAVMAACIFMSRRNASSIIPLAVWCFGLFLVWKHSFLRADASHLLSFFFFLPFLVSGLLVDIRNAWIRTAQLVAAALVLVVVVLSMMRNNPAMLRAMRPDTLLTETEHSLSAALHAGERLRNLRASVVSQAAQYDLGEMKSIVGSSPIDVFGQAQSLAILNGLQYRPRPAFQSFESYTPYLIGRNYERYLNSAPPFALFGYTTIDGRYPAQDDSLVLASLLTDYALVGGGKFDHLLLQKADGFGGIDRKPIAERTPQTGEAVDIPGESGQPIWCTIHLQTTAVSALREVLYQPYDLQLEITDSAGRASLYRLMRGAAETGFIIDPFLKDMNAVVEYLCRVDAGRTRKLRVLAAGGVTGVSVKFSAMPTRRAPSSQCASLVFPMFGVTPRAIEGYHATVETDGKPRLLAHAPASIAVDVPQGSAWLRGEYGLMRGAYEAGGATDGVRFRVLADAAAKTAPLWEAPLRPVENPADRGIHSFRIAIPTGVGKLVLQTDPGPNANANWDWSVWSGVGFEPAGADHR